MKTNENLQKLIYGLNSTIVVKLENDNSNEVKPSNVVKFLIDLQKNNYALSDVKNLFSLTTNQYYSLVNQVQNIINSSNIKGSILRTTFANEQEFNEYTQQEWQAILAQYAITYGWSDEFEEIFDENPIEVYEQYNNQKITNIVSNFTNNKVKEITIKTDYENYVSEIVTDILNSKIVLREHQYQILNTVENQILFNCFEKSNVIIKDTAAFVVSKMIENNELQRLKKVFKDTDQIVRVVVMLYSYYKDNKNEKYEFCSTQQLTTNELKQLRVKIPTSIKKTIIKSLNEQTHIDYVVEKIYKYRSFFKKILINCKYTKEDKISSKYKTYSLIKNKVFNIDKSNFYLSKIEKAKKQGDYLKAIKIASTNPGYLARNLLEYLRYSKNTTIAKKVNLNNTEIINEIRLEGITLQENKRQTKVITDPYEFINSQEFISCLSKTGTKLLWQINSLLDEQSLYENKNQRNVQNKTVYYEKNRPLPAIKKSNVALVKKNILLAIKKTKQKENENLGKVYIDPKLVDYNLQFTGRASSQISLSGSYLTPGSKIDFSELLKENEDKIIRMGIAWRGESCDIDHSLNILDTNEVVYYGNPEYKTQKQKVIITSSGDITHCDKQGFSVEFIDIDINECQKEGLKNIVSSATVYSGKTFDKYEVLWFVSVIDKKQRILPTQNINIELDKMDYAIQVNDKTKSTLGFQINLSTNQLEVLNIAIDNKQNFSNASTLKQKFMSYILNRPKLKNYWEVLNDVISQEQIVTNPNLANLIISEQNYDNVKNDVKIINAKTQLEKLNEVIF